MLVHQILASNIHGKMWKSHTKATNLKYHRQHGKIKLFWKYDEKIGNSEW